MGIDVEERSDDRGRHLVDLLADGAGFERAPASRAERNGVVYGLAGMSLVLLVVALVTLLIR